MKYLSLCPCCGCELTADNSTQKIRCAACKAEFTADELKAPSEDDFNLAAVRLCPKTYDADGYICKNCGSQLATEKTSATYCACCGAPTAKPGRIEKIIRPDSVVPFDIDKAAAKRAFRFFFKKRPFTDSCFAEAAESGKIEAVFFPCRVFGCEIETRLFCSVREDSDRQRFLFRKVLTKHSGLTSCAGNLPDGELMSLLAPYNFDRAVDYSDDAVKKCAVEKQSVSSADAAAAIRSDAENAALREARNSVEADGIVRTASCTHIFKELTAQYVLLPVWVLSCTVGGFTHSFYLNGQSGKIVGSAPFSLKKILLWFGCSAAAVTALGEIIYMAVNYL